MSRIMIGLKTLNIELYDVLLLGNDLSFIARKLIIKFKVQISKFKVKNKYHEVLFDSR